MRPLCLRFRDAGHRLHLVGGVVRDLALDDVEPVDVDLTTDAPPDRTKALLGDSVDERWTQGERFGTIGCRIGGTAFEITTYRAESYDPTSRKPVVDFGTTLEGDLVRRDFTINAMAIEPLDVELVDLHGGLADLDARRLRTPGPPERSFDDDPLRMLRAARFTARFGLTVEPEVLAAMRSRAPRLAIVSAERVHDELVKLLAGPDPARGLALLDTAGLLDAVLPEAVLDDEVLERTPPKALVRLAVLVRAATADDVRRRLRALRFSNDETTAVVRVVELLAGVVDDPPASRAGLRRLRRTAGPHLEALLAAANAVEPVVGASLSRGLDELAVDEPPGVDVRIDGAAVQEALGIGPGRDVGRALGHLDEVLLDEGPLDADEQVRRLRRWWAERGS